ncbi:MAG: restriction endonuclease subunit S, partial [Candidatus Niyogibacteria bacterium]|nr:restriction endonuclease subunit S [Candidatus Niyogibacteria bacterium]
MPNATLQLKGWKETTLRDVAVFNYGEGLKTENRARGRVPVYGSSGITGFHDKALINEPGYIVGRKGTVGSIYYSPIPFFPIDTVYYLTKKDIKCDFRFFYYLLNTLGLDKLNFDSAVPGLSREMAYSLSVNIPEDEAEQRAIAMVLSSLDNKIELLREQNKTLGATAQAIFKEWFVSFNFLNTKGKPYKKSGGKMIDSELGEIPGGWRVGKIKDLINIFSGFAFSSSDFTQGGKYK